jgi:hypothetical protein
MTGTEMVPETKVIFNQITWLIVQEDFVVDDVDDDNNNNKGLYLILGMGIKCLIYSNTDA